nr:hypothetical protein [uncultured Flavobacterium sp.]
MKFIFLVGSEHQLLQVGLVIQNFKIAKDDVILLIQEISPTNKLFHRINDNNAYGRIYPFSNWTFKDLFKYNNDSNYFINLCKDLAKKNTEIFFFASHYSDDSTLLFLSIVNPVKFYLMDEGTASYSVLRHRSVFFSSLKFKLFLKSLLYGRTLREPKSIYYFTRFNFIPGNYDKKLTYIVSKLDKHIYLNVNQFAFLGSSVVELQMMDEEDYLYYLKKVVAKNNNKQLLYFKHRKEDDTKLTKIQEIGFQILDLNQPFENYFSTQTNIPGILGSFFTTSVLINISENFENIPKLDIYVFPMKKLKKQKLVYKNILEYLKNDMNLNFIYLD